MDCNFNAKPVRREWVDDYLDTSEGVKNRLIIHVLDERILRANKMIGLDLVSVKLFHITIRKQLELNYSQGEYMCYLNALYHYSPDEMEMGRIFKHQPNVSKG